MNRRLFLLLSTAWASFAPPIPGHTMSTKRNIRSFGKTYEYLSNPELRSRETGSSQLVIDGAEISGVSFQNIPWHNIKFSNCDFIGGYEIKLSELQNCTFESCRFAGVINWGVAKSVRFFRCQTGGQSNVTDFSGSEDIRFESCAFIGADADVNKWGAIGSRGDATFIDCKVKWFKLAGYKKIVLDGCETQDVGTWTDSPANSGVRYESATVVIKNSKLRGKFDMAASDLQSLTVLDTVLENLDLFNATVKEDVVMERVRGGALRISVEEGARNFVLKDSQIYGNNNAICSVYAGAFNTLLVENNIFGGGPEKRTGIGGGFEPDDKNPQSVLTQSLVLRNNKIPSLRSGRLNAAQVLLESNVIDSLELQQGRIGKLKIVGNTISRSIDFTNTQVKESNVQSLAKGQAKLDGSNVKVN